jgi:four helix bundle protein
MDPRGYRSLRAWELGMELTQAIYKLAAELPPDERYGLTSQMKRAAASIPMNLAEGYGRGGREFVRFISIAYGSLLELETAIDLAGRVGMVSDLTALEERTAELGKVLNGLRRSLVARYGSGPEVRDDGADYGVNSCALRPEI